MVSLLRHNRWLVIAALLLAGLFAMVLALTRKKYRLIQTANTRLEAAHSIIHAYQKLSNDYKSALIYTPGRKPKVVSAITKYLNREKRKSRLTLPN